MTPYAVVAVILVAVYIGFRLLVCFQKERQKNAREKKNRARAPLSESVAYEKIMDQIGLYEQQRKIETRQIQTPPKHGSKRHPKHNPFSDCGPIGPTPEGDAANAINYALAAGVYR
jgi:hypothetical protein